ncbi:Growth-regulating factor [Forsythia ovata]|uniref:Growth-regulating factor n=1 Tax=Forsythia ovata TaxID=205694 RepID=A0ABD1WM38_9LAMI
MSGTGSTSVAVGMGGAGGRLGYGRYRPPFTAVQWQELEHQAMIYKYLVAGLPVPPDLVIPIRHSFEAIFARFFNHPSFIVNEANRQKIAGWTIMLTCIGVLVLTSAASSVSLNSSIRFTLCGIGGDVLLLSGLVMLTWIDQDDLRHNFGHSGCLTFEEGFIFFWWKKLQASLSSFSCCLGMVIEQDSERLSILMSKERGLSIIATVCLWNFGINYADFGLSLHA